MKIKKSKRQLEREKAREELSYTRKWPFALILGTVLGLLVMIDRGSVTTDAGLQSPCRVEVTAESLPARREPDQTSGKSADLKRGDLRGATTTVRNGYRQLSDGTWASEQYLRPLPPVENCTPK